MSFASQLAAAFTPIGAVYDDSSVVRALQFAQDAVEGYCGRTFDLITNDVIITTPQQYRTALLPYVPVVSITLVEGYIPNVNGTSGMGWQALPNYAFVQDTGLIYDTTGQPGVSYSLGESWPRLPGSLRITYSHGYANVPSGIISVACRLAQQYLENPALQMQRRVGDQEARFSGSVGTVISALDQRIMDRYVDIGVS
jgi:hypothetical protein